MIHKIFGIYLIIDGIGSLTLADHDETHPTLKAFGRGIRTAIGALLILL